MVSSCQYECFFLYIFSFTSFNALKIAFFLLISLNLDRVFAMKFLFGLPHDLSGMDDFPEENIRYIQELTTLLGSKVTDEDYSAKSDMKTTLCRVQPFSNHSSLTCLFFLLNCITSAPNQDDH